MGGPAPPSPAEGRLVTPPLEDDWPWTAPAGVPCADGSTVVPARTRAGVGERIPQAAGLPCPDGVGLAPVAAAGVGVTVGVPVDAAVAVTVGV